MSSAYSIEIYVPTGDPEGLRIVSLKNWTGIGLDFPRQSWTDVKKRDEFTQTGIYILTGYREENPDLPVLYIGQTDDLKRRIDQHNKNKPFWDRCIVFVSSNNFLNRAHICWLEWFLYSQAKNIGQCDLDNAQEPQEPTLAESEKADMLSFSSQILQILPLIGVRAIEEPKKFLAVPKEELSSYKNDAKLNTVIVPAKKEGFEEAFIGKNSWWAIRIGGGMLDQLRYIAAYQVRPISAITHVAEIETIEPYGDTGKYKLTFKGPPKEIKPIPYGDAPNGSMQSHRYTNHQILNNAKTIKDLLFG